MDRGQEVRYFLGPAAPLGPRRPGRRVRHRTPEPSPATPPTAGAETTEATETSSRSSSARAMRLQASSTRKEWRPQLMSSRKGSLAMEEARSARSRRPARRCKGNSSAGFSRSAVSRKWPNLARVRYKALRGREANQLGLRRRSSAVIAGLGHHDFT